MMLPEMALLALLAWLCYQGLAVRSVPATYAPAPSPAEGAIRITRQRLANGELDRDDFDRIVRILTS